MLANRTLNCSLRPRVTAEKVCHEDSVSDLLTANTGSLQTRFLTLPILWLILQCLNHKAIIFLDKAHTLTSEIFFIVSDQIFQLGCLNFQSEKHI